VRIAHISDCFLPRLGGIEVQVNDLTRRQLEAGMQPEIITASPAPRDWTSMTGVPVHRSGLPIPAEIANNPLPSRPIRKVLRQGDFDVVHVHAGVGSPFAAAGVRAALRLGLPVVVTVHCLRPAVPLPAVLSPWTSRTIAHRLELTAVSEAAAAPLRERTGVPVAVMPNGLDPADWRADPLPRDPRRVEVVATMRLAGRKRPMPLLAVVAEAARRLAPEVDLHLTVYGDGVMLRRMQTAVATRGLQDVVTLAGRVQRDALPQIYRRADVFIAPAFLESFGIAPLEARTAGVPVLAMRGSGVTEFIEDGREGLLAGDDDEMIDALVRIGGDAELRRRIADHNRSTEPPQTWPKVLEHSENAYQRAIARTRQAD